MKVLLYATMVASATLCLPTTSQAQNDDAEPVIHWITATTWQVPFGDRPAALMWVDSVLVPLARLDPNVVSMRVATHNWGANSNDIIMISEYASWDGINADCEPCDEWFEARQPAEGTPERETWDGWLNDFLAAYSGHHDEIYTVNMNRAK